MEMPLFWAGVHFAAQNGDVEGFLSDAARNSFHLSAIAPLPGGCSARCPAWRYRKLAALARKRRVHLHITERTGIYFAIRPYLRRRGLWAGLVLFVPLLFWSQHLVWAVDTTSLSAGQSARAIAALREEVSLMPGSFVTQEKLAAGEYALLRSGEFSWASLNFLDGRLIVEAAEAAPVPEIAAGTPDGLCAKASGTVVRTNLTSGTMLVSPGQAVEAGQLLIGTSRTRRDGTATVVPAAGEVLAQLEWEHLQIEPLHVSVNGLTGVTRRQWKLFFDGFCIPLPVQRNFPEDARTIARHLQPDLFGLMLPFSIEETTCYEQAETVVDHTEEQGLSLARLHSLQALHAAYPDAEILARKEDVSIEQEALHYRAVYTILTDLCR